MRMAYLVFTDRRTAYFLVIEADTVFRQGIIAHQAMSRIFALSPGQSEEPLFCRKVHSSRIS
jgi:hypothetical protein